MIDDAVVVGDGKVSPKDRIRMKTEEAASWVAEEVGEDTGNVNPCRIQLKKEAVRSGWTAMTLTPFVVLLWELILTCIA